MTAYSSPLNRNESISISRCCVASEAPADASGIVTVVSGAASTAEATLSAAGDSTISPGRRRCRSRRRFLFLPRLCCRRCYFRFRFVPGTRLFRCFLSRCKNVHVAIAPYDNYKGRRTSARFGCMDEGETSFLDALPSSFVPHYCRSFTTLSMISGPMISADLPKPSMSAFPAMVLMRRGMPSEYSNRSASA